MPPEIKTQLPETKPTWQDDVQMSQSDYFAQHGKYQLFKKDTLAVDTETHEYVGPLGAGYVMFEYKTIDGKLFARATNVGPETWRSHDWVNYDN